MRRRVIATVSMTTTLLVMSACSTEVVDRPVAVPSGESRESSSGPSTSPGPSSGVATTEAAPAADTGGTAVVDGAPPVEVRSAALPDDQAAVVGGLAAFLGDWSAVVAQPGDPALRDSAHATPDGDAALRRAAATLTENESRIVGDLVLLDPVVRVDAGVSAQVSACLDQSAVDPVALDGTVLTTDEPERVTAQAALVRSGGGWSVVDFVVEGESC